MDRLKYSDDLAMRAAIQIVDAHHQQVFMVFGTFGLQHAQEHLQTHTNKKSPHGWNQNTVIISSYPQHIELASRNKVYHEKSKEPFFQSAQQTTISRI